MGCLQNILLLANKVAFDIDRYSGHIHICIVQLGPKLQSSAQVMAQSKHYIQSGIHHPNPPPQTF